MAAYTLAEVNAELTLWKAALSACSRKQEYTIGDRSLTYADLPEIRQTIDWLESKQTRLTSGGSRTRAGVAIP